MPPLSSSKRVRFDRFELDLETGELWREGTPLDLPPQPARVLTILVSEAGTVVGRLELRKRIWGDTWLDWESALHQAIRRIRVALDDSAQDPRFVETLPRRGYRFMAPVAQDSRQDASHGASETRPGPLAVALGLVAFLVVVGSAVLLAWPNLVEWRADATEEQAHVPPEASRLLREGVHLLSRGAVPEAAVRFRRAAAAAPDWSAPWSAIAEVELAQPGGQRVVQARAAIERALSRDSRDVRAWRLLGSLRLWEEWDWVGARGAFDEAARIAPNDAEVWQMVAALETVLMREDEAIEAAERAIALDPISTARHVDLGWTLYYFGHIDQALSECRRSLEVTPESPWARQCVLQSLLVLGRHAEANSLLASTVELDGDDPIATFFERHLVLLSSAESCASAAAAAIPKIILGDEDGAFAALLDGANERRGWELPYARLDPLLAPLRKQPRFVEVERALQTSFRP